MVGGEVASAKEGQWEFESADWQQFCTQVNAINKKTYPMVGVGRGEGATLLLSKAGALLVLDRREAGVGGGDCAKSNLDLVRTPPEEGTDDPTPTPTPVMSSEPNREDEPEGSGDGWEEMTAAGVAPNDGLERILLA